MIALQKLKGENSDAENLGSNVENADNQMQLIRDLNYYNLNIRLKYEIQKIKRVDTFKSYDTYNQSENKQGTVKEDDLDEEEEKENKEQRKVDEFIEVHDEDIKDA